MKYHPIPGDIVRLSSEGLDDVSRHGVLNSYDAMDRSKRMTIIYVTPEPLTEPEPLWGVEVDHPEINRLMLHSGMFQLIERPATPRPNKVQPRMFNMEEAIALGIARVETHHDGKHHFRKIIFD